MAIFGGVRAARLVNRVNKNMTMAVRLMQSRQALAAVRYNAAALADVAKLVRLEPHDPEHQRMRGSLHYNEAAIFEQLGRLDGAVAAARFALTAYESLPGGRTTPENIPMLGLLSISSSFGPRSVDHEQSLETVALVADTRARLARLLARASGAAAAAEVHELGRAAIATYEQFPDRGADLARVRRQYEEAQRALNAS